MSERNEGRARTVGFGRMEIIILLILFLWNSGTKSGWNTMMSKGEVRNGENFLKYLNDKEIKILYGASSVIFFSR